MHDDYYITFQNSVNSEANKNALDQILSTFKFTTQQILPQENQYSLEGESCGPNAGQAGNAECEPNLKCEYQTQEDIENKIGTCVKE